MLKRYCIPIIRYAAEALCSDKTSAKRLDKLADTAVHNIFKTVDESVTCGTTKIVGLRILQELTDECQSKFLKKIKNITVIQLTIACDNSTNFKCMY